MQEGDGLSGRGIAWLASDPGAAKYAGRNLHSQILCAELGLVEGWPPDDPSWRRNA